MNTTKLFASALVLATLTPPLQPRPATAQSDEALDDALFSTMMAEDAVMFADVGVYSLDDGTRFTLDRSSNRQALLKFEGQDEVLALSVVQGPRGDAFLKSDTDETVVRVTHLGNVIFYSDEAPEGTPAQLNDQAEDIQPPDVDEDFEDGFAAFAAVQLQRPIDADLPILTGGSQVWVQDAARLMVDGVLASGASGAAIENLTVKVGEEPAVSLSEAAELTVTIVPERGYAGRLSSERISRTIKADPPAS